MPILVRLVMLGSFIGVIDTGAFACNASYDPVTGSVSVPCIDIAHDTRSLAAVLQATAPNTFVVTSVAEFMVVYPTVTSLRIIAAPPNVVALVTGPDPGCAASLQRPRITQAGDRIDIELKARLMLTPIVACPAVVSSFVEAFVLPFGDDPRAHSYSINGMAITPTFLGSLR